MKVLTQDGLDYLIHWIKSKIKSENHSLSEENTGNTWIDGRTIYRKSYRFNIVAVFAAGKTVREFEESFITDETFILRSECTMAMAGANGNRWSGGADNIDSWINKTPNQTGKLSFAATVRITGSTAHPVDTIVTIYYVK